MFGVNANTPKTPKGRMENVLGQGVCLRFVGGAAAPLVLFYLCLSFYLLHYLQTLKKEGWERGAPFFGYVTYVPKTIWASVVLKQYEGFSFYSIFCTSFSVHHFLYSVSVQHFLVRAFAACAWRKPLRQRSKCDAFSRSTQKKNTPCKWGHTTALIQPVLPVLKFTTFFFPKEMPVHRKTHFAPTWGLTVF